MKKCNREFRIRLNQAEERMYELEDSPLDIAQLAERGKKRMKKREETYVAWEFLPGETILTCGSLSRREKGKDRKLI